jgi:hypothetical protein
MAAKTAVLRGLNAHGQNLSVFGGVLSIPTVPRLTWAFPALEEERPPMVKITLNKGKTTTDLIYRRYATSMDQDERTYLGASVIGNDCWRALWYAFRWAYPYEPPSPRMLRLFDTGHREETRVIDDLRAGGAYVFGEQTAFSAFGGHFRGHIDGVIAGVMEAPKTPHILEIKTHNERSYKALIKDGVEKSKPAHYAQMQIYMMQLKYERALYVAVNKNDDSIYTVRIYAAPKHQQALMDKAEHIITTSEAPPKLHEDPEAPAAYACLWCPAKEVCHDGAMPRSHCRTCVSSTPITDGEDGLWRCEYHNKLLTLDEQRAGCKQHLYLPSLVPGEQVDADPDKRTVTYKMRYSGEEWIDGGTAS